MAGSASAEGFTEEELAAALQLLRSRQAQSKARPPVKDEGTVFIRGEGGSVFEMTPSKMSSDLKRRLRLGYLRQVNADGSPLRENTPAPAPGGPLGQEPVPRPAKSAPKKDWVLYAVTALGLDAERAEGMTRQELIDLPADHAQHPGPTPGNEPVPTPAGARPDEDAPKSEWIAHVVSKGLLSAEDASNYTKADLIDLAT
ncbi:hypothetical protein RM704_15560 [Streptomyces sp. DSM 3412]|uniref:Uncharacterized protein n=1 Tax=Streptomyces gottesmaniae TaxID=3075518 RepID=A0ABU2YX14_9ACTN|nr:hypothetical protein [Streptomyces sp. DSM 3412]MDT0568869.1 hypothetical protein [Streptomyces sp. DSM 3412]